MPHDTDYIVDVIVAVVERYQNTPEKRLARGDLIRKAMFEAIGKGEEFPHYRYQWFVQSIERVRTLMMLIAKDFNDSHPDDMVSGNDVLDVLQYCHGQLAKLYQEHADKEKK